MHMPAIDLHRELSYQLIGIAMNVHSNYGTAHKEVIYERALAEKFSIAKVPIKNQPKLAVYSVDTKMKLGWYQPDFLVDDKIIVELKATAYPIKAHEIQLRDYLKCSTYELGYLLNFGMPSLYFKRIILTNLRKP